MGGGGNDSGILQREGLGTDLTGIKAAISWFCFCFVYSLST